MTTVPGLSGDLGHEQEQARVPGCQDRQTGSQRVEFFVTGTPAPQGSKRHVGGGRMIESSKAVGPWRACVAWTAQLLIGRFVGPVEVTIRFYLKRPASAPKSRRYPDRKPDIDKLVRSTLDGLVESGVIEDDARVVLLGAGKFYAEPGQPCGARIVIWEAS